LGLIKDNPEAGSSRAGEDLKQAGPGELWPKHCSAERPSNIGSGLEDLINHSRSQEREIWVRIPKGKQILESSLGFPAHREEVRRFGWRARKIYKIHHKFVDSRSFAEVVEGDPMERKWREEQCPINKRRQEERDLGGWEERRGGAKRRISELKSAGSRRGRKIGRSGGIPMNAGEKIISAREVMESGQLNQKWRRTKRKLRLRIISKVSKILASILFAVWGISVMGGISEMRIQ
jgi:hypothetical protein